MRELYRVEELETSLNVTLGRVDSVRRKHIVKSGCRVYENGFVGIAGTLGEATEATWAEAEKNLARQLPYPYAPEAGKVRHEDRRVALLDDKTFTERAEALLARLKDAFPRMIFSNKINMTRITAALTNENGLDYTSFDCIYLVELLAKDVDSVNVFETGVIYQSRTFDVDEIFGKAAQIMEAHQHSAELPQGETLPVIAPSYLLTEFLMAALNGQSLHQGASLLSGKLGKALFSPDVTLSVDRTAEALGARFFDAEGAVLPEDRLTLIDQGVLVRATADKKTAAEFQTDNTASAVGSYDDLPQLGSTDVSFASSGKTLKALLAGRDAAYVVIASGGDSTDDGVLASPVQTAYLYRDGRLTGRLPEFSISGSLFDLLGKDYLGRTEDRLYDGNHGLVVTAKITK